MLAKDLSDFERRISLLRGLFERCHAERARGGALRRIATQEGLLSMTWQAWNYFCRSVIIHSALGCSTKSGVQTSTSVQGLQSEAHVAFIAASAARGQKISGLRPIAGKHLEPTWGDVAKLNVIVPQLGLSNAGNIVSGIGSVNFGSKHMQLVRNACAHYSDERISDVNGIRLYYRNTGFRHPSDAIFWLDQSGATTAWETWIDELLLGAHVAVN